jgi:pimeloyl-ACP methyl ester carboxylesterase
MPSWDIKRSGPDDAATTVLLLAGGMCGTTAFDQIASELRDAPVQLVAATIPGMAGSEQPAQPTIEHYAAITGELAAEVGADVVGGHSLGANIALEMAACGAYRAPLLLLSPSFSREDEVSALGVLSRLGRIPLAGGLLWRVAIAAIPHSMPKHLPGRDELVADMRRNDPAFCRRAVRAYFEYLDAHGSVARRLCNTGVRAVVAFGDNDEIGLTEAERVTLEACDDVTLATIADATHMLICEQPRVCADLLLDVAGVAVG